MTAPVFTIPARLVGEGMILASDGRAISRVQCDPSGPLRRLHMAIPEAFDPDAQMPEITAYDYSHDAPVDVTLPGPSPRELLCECQYRADAHQRLCCDAFFPSRKSRVHVLCESPERHAAGCPVRRRWLRLWPVGATWSSAKAAAWIVWLGKLTFAVTPEDVRNDFAGWQDFDGWDRAMVDDLRAAFCEPKVQL